MPIDDILGRCWFKYRSIFRGEVPSRKNRDLQILRENTLWFGDRTQQNDRSELKPLYYFSQEGAISEADFDRNESARLGHLPQEVRAAKKAQFISETEQENYLDLYRACAEEAVEEYLSSCVLCSFSRRGNIEAMWANYSANHTGYALGFDPSVPWPAITKSRHSKDVLDLNFLAFNTVQYQDDYPRIDLDAAARGEPSDWVKQAFLTKHTQWQTEQEGRVIIDQALPANWAYPPDMLKVLVFGASISAEDQAFLTSLSRDREHPPALFKAQHVRGQHDPELRPID